MTLPTDSGFPLLHQASYQLIPTLPLRTMKVIKVINMFVCIPYEFCTLPTEISSLLTLRDPISCTDIPAPWRCNKNILSAGYGKHLKTQMLPVVPTVSQVCMKHKHHRGLACLSIVLSNGLPAQALSFHLLCALFCSSPGPTVGVTMATISVLGEYLALGWSAITGLLKALSLKISQFPTEKRSSQHSRRISEPERGIQTERKVV